MFCPCLALSALLFLLFPFQLFSKDEVSPVCKDIEMVGTTQSPDLTQPVSKTRAQTHVAVICLVQPLLTGRASSQPSPG